MHQLLDWVGFQIKNYLTQVPDFLPVFTQVWGMGYDVNDVTPAHSHEPVFMSFTYYPYVEDPEMCAEHVQDKTKQWGETLLSIPPHSGQLVVFPSYCYHQVKPVKIQTQRYCIAGNVHHDFDNATTFNT